jgi:hypothetical protein
LASPWWHALQPQAGIRELPGVCPKCHEIGPCWYLCSQCADDGYLCILPKWTVSDAGVLTNPTTIANVAHLLAYYLKVQPSQEVMEKSRQHYDLLLNIHRPESNCIVARSPFELPKLPESGLCVNCMNHGPCWGLCWFDKSCTTEGHLFAPIDSGRLVEYPAMLNKMAKLAAYHLPRDILPMAGRIHFDYMVDAYVWVLAPVTCQSWLEICRVGKSTSLVAQNRAKEYCDATGVTPREDGF